MSVCDVFNVDLPLPPMEFLSFTLCNICTAE